MGDLPSLTLTGNQVAFVLMVFTVILFVSIAAAYREGTRDREDK